MTTDPIDQIETILIQCNAAIKTQKTRFSRSSKDQFNLDLAIESIENAIQLLKELTKPKGTLPHGLS